jgi:hypothetical protein
MSRLLSQGVKQGIDIFSNRGKRSATCLFLRVQYKHGGFFDQCKMSAEHFATAALQEIAVMRFGRDFFGDDAGNFCRACGERRDRKGEELAVDTPSGRAAGKFGMREPIFFRHLGREPCSALPPTTCEQVAAVCGRRAPEKAVRASSFSLFGLICPFHKSIVNGLRFTVNRKSLGLFVLFSVNCSL